MWTMKSRKKKVHRLNQQFHNDRSGKSGKVMQETSRSGRDSVTKNIVDGLVHCETGPAVIHEFVSLSGVKSQTLEY